MLCDPILYGPHYIPDESWVRSWEWSCSIYRKRDHPDGPSFAVAYPSGESEDIRGLCRQLTRDSDASYWAGADPNARGKLQSCGNVDAEGERYELGILTNTPASDFFVTFDIMVGLVKLLTLLIL